MQDPSLSHATNAPVRNLLGAPGAIAADLMMQLVRPSPRSRWCCRSRSGAGGSSPTGRSTASACGSLWIVGALAAAAFASCLPTIARWPLPTGLGGVIGDALLRLPACWLVGGRCPA